MSASAWPAQYDGWLANTVPRPNAGRSGSVPEFLVLAYQSDTFCNHLPSCTNG